MYAIDMSSPFAGFSLGGGAFVKARMFYFNFLHYSSKLAFAFTDIDRFRGVCVQPSPPPTYGPACDTENLKNMFKNKFTSIF